MTSEASAVSQVVKSLNDVLVEGDQHLGALALAINDFNCNFCPSSGKNKLVSMLLGFLAQKNDRCFGILLRSMPKRLWAQVVNKDLNDNLTLFSAFMRLAPERAHLVELYLEHLEAEHPMLQHKAAYDLHFMFGLDEFEAAARLIKRERFTSAFFSCVPFVHKPHRALVGGMTRRYVHEYSQTPLVDLQRGLDMELALFACLHKSEGAEFDYYDAMWQLASFLKTAVKSNCWRITPIPLPLLGAVTIFKLLETEAGTTMLLGQPELRPALHRAFEELKEAAAAQLLAQVFVVNKPNLSAVVLAALADHSMGAGSRMLKSAIDVSPALDSLSGASGFLALLESDDRNRVAVMLNAAAVQAFNLCADDDGLAQRRQQLREIIRYTSADAGKWLRDGAAPTVTELESVPPVETADQEVPASAVVPTSICFEGGKVKLVFSNGAKAVVDPVLESCSFSNAEMAA